MWLQVKQTDWYEELLMKLRQSRVIATVLLMLCICLGAVSYGADSPEEIFWKSVRKSDVVEEYKLYVDQYPKGKYSSEAWRQIGRLEAKAEAEAQSTRKADESRRAEAELLKREELSHWQSKSGPTSWMPG